MEDVKTTAKTIKAFYAACSSKGITDEERHVILCSYGREHVSEMTAEELQDAINKINQREDTEEGARSKWVRRAMAVTFQYLNKTVNDRDSVTTDYVKEVITTSQRGISFNTLSKQQLIKAFYLFKYKSEHGEEKQ